MEIELTQGNLVEQVSDCLVVNLFESDDDKPRPGGATAALDSALGGAIQQVIDAGDFDGKAGSTALIYTNGQIPAPRVLVVGLGKQAEFDLHGVRRVAATVAHALADLPGVRAYSSVIHGAGAGGLDAGDAAQAMAEGTLLATYKAPQYRREAAERSLERCTVVEYDIGKIEAVEAGLSAGRAIACGVISARDYISEPGNVLQPVELARRARAMAEETGLVCSVLGEREMSELGMGILLAVSVGSENEAQMILLEHAPDGTAQRAPLVLVGKGVTFDTGGISLKPTTDMWYMKDDMGGAAAVVGAMEAIAKLNLPRRVIGVATCVENMPDGRAFRPGDILTGITGKTTEIISTDAEGRLILADTLGYIARFEPAAVVDLATLTGAVGVALGPQAAGLFANDETLSDALLTAAALSGERLWPMPMYDEYLEDIRSDMAEVKNSSGRMDGVATSAKFLEHFTEGYPWAHLDIASMVWAKKSPAPHVPQGATGFGVRLLVELAKTYA